jgi:hypothetical protein
MQCVCTEHGPSQYALRSAHCNSSVCKSVSAEFSDATCGWYLQLHACQATGITKISQHGCHLASAASPTNGKLNLQMKRFVREKTKLKLKPGQILNSSFRRIQVDRRGPPASESTATIDKRASGTTTFSMR